MEDLINSYRSADVFDSVAVAVELETLANIEMAREQAKKLAASQKLKATGECHYCRNTVPDGELFCDDECHTDWVDEEEKRSHLRKINAHLDVREYA